MGKSLSKVAWFDPKAFNSENSGYNEELKEDIEINRFSKITEIESHLKSNPQTYFIVITSGSGGKDLMQRIHSLQNVTQVFIFCLNRSHHEEWAEKYSKIKNICTSYSEIRGAIKKAVELNETSLAMGATSDFALFKEVVDFNIGK